MGDNLWRIFVRRRGLMRLPRRADRLIAHKLCSGRIAKGIVVALSIQAELSHNLLIPRRSPKAVLKGADGFREFPTFSMNRAGGPVHGPHLVDHGATDTNTRKGFEGSTFAWIKFSCSLEKPQGARLQQIIKLHGRRQAMGEVVGNALYQGRILTDQLCLLLLSLRRSKAPVTI